MKNNDTTQKLYEFLSDYIKTHNYSPSFREICSKFGFVSTSSAHYYMNILKNQGLISFDGTKKRNISLNGTAERSDISLASLLGEVAAGTPILAVEEASEYLPLIEEFKGDDYFALKINGKSMIDAGIMNGDYVIVKNQSSCQDGEIVIALTDNSATCKRFFRKDGKYVLHPENELYDDIILD